MSPDQFARLVMDAGPFVTAWFVVVMATFLFGPFVAVYCLIRVLRDLRRIAVALEAANVNPTDIAHKKFLEADDKKQREEQGNARIKEFFLS